MKLILDDLIRILSQKERDSGEHLSKLNAYYDRCDVTIRDENILPLSGGQFTPPQKNMGTIFRVYCVMA